MPTSPVCIVTGANKGIGLAVARAMCSLSNPVIVYLTSRDEVRGEQAVQSLKSEGLEARYHQLDITDDGSIKALYDYMEKEHGGIDVLINNAGFAFTHDSEVPFAEQAKVSVETNFGGTRKVCKTLFPLLNKGGRVVNVSSNCGHLSKINGDEPAAGILRGKLSSKELTDADLVKMMEEFVTLAAQNEHVAHGWPNSAYKVSKVGVSALSILQQRVMDIERPGEDIAINHAHPGFVNTDMSSHKGPKSVEEGAKPIVFAATLPTNTDIKGEYIWEDCTVTCWVEEKVKLFY